MTIIMVCLLCVCSFLTDISISLGTLFSQSYSFSVYLCISIQFCLVLCRCSAFESEVKRLRIFKKVRVCEECYKNLKQSTNHYFFILAALFSA